MQIESLGQDSLRSIASACQEVSLKVSACISGQELESLIVLSSHRRDWRRRVIHPAARNQVGVRQAERSHERRIRLLHAAAGPRGRSHRCQGARRVQRWRQALRQQRGVHLKWPGACRLTSHSVSHVHLFQPVRADLMLESDWQSEHPASHPTITEKLAPHQSDKDLCNSALSMLALLWGSIGRKGPMMS